MFTVSSRTRPLNQIQGAAVRRARLPRRLGVRLGVRDVHLVLRRRLRGVGRLHEEIRGIFPIM